MKTSDTIKKQKVMKPKKEKNIQKLAVSFISDPTEENFNKLCERINWGLRSHIFKIVKDDDATTEILTRTLENIYYKRDQFNPEIAKFSTWMYKIAFNNSLKYIQENRGNENKVDINFEDLYDSTVCSDGDDIYTDSEANSYTTSNDTVDILFKNNEHILYDKERVIADFYDASVKCIDYLPDNLRVVMRDRLIEQKKINSIAYDNNIPITSVKNWLRKGKSELQEIIKDKYGNLYDMYMEMSMA